LFIFELFLQTDAARPGLLGPAEYQDIIDKERDEKIDFIRKHPYLCNFKIKKDTACTFRAISEAGFKVHARSQHNWKPGELLLYKYIDVSGILPRVAAAPVVAAPAVSFVAALTGSSGAVAQVSPSAAAAVAQKRRLCAACRQPGHQANSKRCPSKQQKLELESDDESDDVDEE
jgi:hypothetical protein